MKKFKPAKKPIRISPVRIACACFSLISLFTCPVLAADGTAHGAAGLHVAGVKCVF